MLVVVCSKLLTTYHLLLTTYCFYLQDVAATMLVVVCSKQFVRNFKSAVQGWIKDLKRALKTKKGSEDDVDDKGSHNACIRLCACIECTS